MEKQNDHWAEDVDKPVVQDRESSSDIFCCVFKHSRAHVPSRCHARPVDAKDKSFGMSNCAVTT